MSTWTHQYVIIPKHLRCELGQNLRVLVDEHVDGGAGADAAQTQDPDGVPAAHRGACAVLESGQQRLDGVLTQPLRAQQRLRNVRDEIENTKGKATRECL